MFYQLQVNIPMLHVNDTQVKEIHEEYNRDNVYYQLYADDIHSQQSAIRLLENQGLVLQTLGDLGNGWSKRWSSMEGKDEKRYIRVLLQWWG